MKHKGQLSTLTYCLMVDIAANILIWNVSHFDSLIYYPDKEYVLVF